MYGGHRETAEMRTNRHLILIGFMGCGKSSVSAALAKRLNRRLVDTDARIEAEQGCSVSRIFEEHGEAFFRELERGLLARLGAETEPLIISAGGGLAAQPQNTEPLRALGTVIYLRVQPQTALARLAGDTTRPLLQGKDKEEKIRALLAAREPLYMAAADICIDTDAFTPKELAEQIIARCR